MRPRLTPRVGGVLHSLIAPWSPVTYSFDVRGCKEASWEVFLSRGKRHPALVRGALVELMDGPAVVWSGVLAEPNWREGTMKADGLAYDGGRFPSLDGSGNASSNPTTVANANITRGWKIASVASSVPNTSYTTSADGNNSQTDLYEANSDELGQRHYVGADRVLRFAADPTTPTWYIRPKLVDLGIADDEYASTINVRYRSSVSAYATAARTDAAVLARFGYRGFQHDVTAYGVISAARANAIGDGILLKGRARLGWTNSIEVGSVELLTAGRVPADLTMVEGGRQMLRVDGIYDDVQFLGGHTYLDVVIGESVHTDGSGVISLSPVGAVADTFDEIVAETTAAAFA